MGCSFYESKLYALGRRGTPIARASNETAMGKNDGLLKSAIPSGGSSQKNLGGGRAPERQLNIVSSVTIISSRWKDWGELDKKCGGGRGPLVQAWNRHWPYPVTLIDLHGHFMLSAIFSENKKSVRRVRPTRYAPARL